MIWIQTDYQILDPDERLSVIDMDGTYESILENFNFEKKYQQITKQHANVSSMQRVKL